MTRIGSEAIPTLLSLICRTPCSNGSTAVSERNERTAQGYCRFRCRACGKQFNEWSAGSLNQTQHRSDVIAAWSPLVLAP
jgi:hypothetical protein